MRVLYHSPLCPFSRKVRLALGEKKLEFQTQNENFWEHAPSLYQLNPLGFVPILVELNGHKIVDSGAICAYLDEAYPDHTQLLSTDLYARCEARKLANWFDSRFANEVVMPIIWEKILKRLVCRMQNQSGAPPASDVIRNCKAILNNYLDYLNTLLEERNWLAGDSISLADFSLAAHLSVLDYLGDVMFDKHKILKQWYMRLKSRPSFRPLLEDKFQGVKPFENYSNLDF